jgi:hypothetical protein
MSWLGEERHSKPKLQEEDSKTQKLQNSRTQKETNRFAGDML